MTNPEWRAQLPPSWITIVDQLMSDLASVDEAVEILEMREKFGELRVYLSRQSDRAGRLIDPARAKSRRTCQDCGGRGVLMIDPSRLYATKCARHAEPEGFRPARFCVQGYHK